MRFCLHLRRRVRWELAVADGTVPRSASVAASKRVRCVALLVYGRSWSEGSFNLTGLGETARMDGEMNPAHGAPSSFTRH